MVMSRKVLYLVVATIASLWIGTPQVRAVATLDLSTAGSSGYVNGAYFELETDQGTGSGTLNSFVRIQTNKDMEQGYNTDWRPLEFNENNSGTFTRSLDLSLVPVVTKSGTQYREFVLDLNEDSGRPGQELLSLDELQIFQGSAPDLHNFAGGGLGTPIFDMENGAGNWVLLNADLNGGSGSGDVRAYIPNSLFGSGQYVYLYSKFGAQAGYANSGGYEEWAVRKIEPEPPVPPIPAPAAVLLVLCGGSIAVSLHRRRAI
jgi:hypothetical protein